MVDTFNALYKTTIGKNPDLFPNPFFLKTLDGLFVICNSHFENFFGVAGKSIIHKKNSDIFPSEFANQLDSWEQDLYHDHNRHIHETTVMAADNEKHSIQVILTSIVDTKNNVIGISGIIVDLSVLFKIHNQLYNDHKKATNIISSIKEAVIMIDEREYIQLWNNAAEEMFGYSSYEVIDENLHTILGFSITKIFEEAKTAKDKKSKKDIKSIQCHELLVKRRKGTYLPIEFSISLIEIDGLTYYMTVIRDITDRKRAEQDLLAAKKSAEELNRLKDEFLTNMSHEFRTPLNGIIGTLSLLKATTVSEEVKELVSIMEDSSQKLMKLIENLLDFSHINAIDFSLKFTTISLKALVQEIRESMESKISKKNIVFNIYCDIVDETPVKADVLRIIQVLSHLLSNAKKFTEKGRISLYISELKRDETAIFLEFQVADTGCGIDKEDLASIFEHFSQVDGSMSRNSGGLGLGLSHAKKIIEKMEGSITVESSIGQGSIFTVTLPLENITS